jgi:ATP-binding cassette subfamily F protein uup
MDFPGCIIVVSHDRYFMDKIVDHLFVFNQSGTITDFPGNYSDFRAYVGNTDIALEQDEKPALPQPKPQKSAPKKIASTPAAPTREQQKELSRLENKIKKLEDQRDSLQKSFLDPELSTDQMTQNSIDLEKVKNELEDIELDWLELSEVLS